MNAVHCLFFWAVVALLSSGFPPESSWAASDARYAQMLRESEDLREADQALREALQEARKNLMPEDFKKIQDLQDEWIKKEREANIAEYVNSGLSLPEAWAMELGSRADYIAEKSERLHFKRTAKGVEGVYESVRDASGAHAGAVLQIRKEENIYLVTVEISRGSGEGVEMCAWSGEGRLSGNILKASMEDNTAARLRITFSGNTAAVVATRAANAECGSDVRLDGVYAK
ncbi:MAG: hypothetical protein K2O70_10960 [Desulfovibrionaceae bacterium]|nr:hypothetical protein [Desulfovibrionaceae bacterium]